MSVQELHRDVHSHHPNHAIIRRVDTVWPDTAKPNHRRSDNTRSCVKPHTLYMYMYGRGIIIMFHTAYLIEHTFNLMFTMHLLVNIFNDFLSTERQGGKFL